MSSATSETSFSLKDSSATTSMEPSPTISFAKPILSGDIVPEHDGETLTKAIGPVSAKELQQ